MSVVIPFAARARGGHPSQPAVNPATIEAECPDVQLRTSEFTRRVIALAKRDPVRADTILCTSEFLLDHTPPTDGVAS